MNAHPLIFDLLVTWQVLSSLLTIIGIGQERKPYTPGFVVVALVLSWTCFYGWLLVAGIVG